MGRKKKGQKQDDSGNPQIIERATEESNVAGTTPQTGNLCDSCGERFWNEETETYFCDEIGEAIGVTLECGSYRRGDAEDGEAGASASQNENTDSETATPDESPPATCGNCLWSGPCEDDDSEDPEILACADNGELVDPAQDPCDRYAWELADKIESEKIQDAADIEDGKSLSGNTIENDPLTDESMQPKSTVQLDLSRIERFQDNFDFAVRKVYDYLTYGTGDGKPTIKIDLKFKDDGRFDVGIGVTLPTSIKLSLKTQTYIRENGTLRLEVSPEQLNLLDMGKLQEKAQAAADEAGKRVDEGEAAGTDMADDGDLAAQNDAIKEELEQDLGTTDQALDGVDELAENLSPDDILDATATALELSDDQTIDKTAAPDELPTGDTTNDNV